MKTSKYTTKTIYLMKTILFISVIVVFSNCSKNEDINYLLQNEWKIKSISIDKKSLKPTTKNLREEAYILKFANDSYFSLATSVNYAGGKYQIVSDKNITISDYNTHTEVCCENDFDKQLISIMNEISNYSCKENKLIFTADKNREIVFNKK